MWTNITSAARYASGPLELISRMGSRFVPVPSALRSFPALLSLRLGGCDLAASPCRSVAGGVLGGNGTGVQIPATTHSGYISIDREGAALFYMYYAAKDVLPEDAPVLLWLQGGPGASSLMGNLYELIGPQKVTEDLGLRDNPWAWNRHVNLLFIEQPLGTGFSVTGPAASPKTLVESSQDLYAALQNFYSSVLQNPTGGQRRLIVGGESYAGKFVPGLAHLILQLAAESGKVGRRELSLLQNLPQRDVPLTPPRFELVAAMIGNGLTDPLTQVVTMPEAAYFQGIIDDEQRAEARRIVARILELADSGEWHEAHTQRLALIDHLTKSGGIGTTLDIRRYQGYDGSSTVLRYLNQPEVKEALGIAKDVDWIRKSPVVKEAMYADNLQSAKPLLPDVLASVPVLLYQGATDIQDGVASNEAWIYGLDWSGQEKFNDAPRTLLVLGSDGETLSPHTSFGDKFDAAELTGRVVGYERAYGPLTHVALRNAGHMAPHDQPDAVRAMFESWLHKNVVGKPTDGAGLTKEGEWVAVAA